jgi:xanthine dehydrogenase YagR molybdenum-binding subunit
MINTAAPIRCWAASSPATIAGYLVPTNADTPERDVLFVSEFDQQASPLSSKSLGALTAVSVAPTIANAVYRATGVRVRDLPMTVEELL